MIEKKAYGVFQLTEELHNTLRSYLESTYHIRNQSLIAERLKLLESKEIISQEPYVESTPSYELGKTYNEIKIPDSAKRILTEVSKLDIGVYPRPYMHQSKALEAFLGEKKDIIVATGTGSGKTESFLMPILGSLASEGTDRPISASMPGCRAILIYPMNALVNDQLGRIRKLFGSESVAELLKVGRNRPIRFGSYTSKTPYPGEFDSTKNKLHLRPMFEDFYLKHTLNPKLVAEMKEKGKWPSKDLIRFYGKDKEDQTVFKSGKRKGKLRTIWNWDKRLRTQPDDRELMTRHEMQELCPDILITNYSMLEYMLIRPIERPIFDQTKQWLDSDEKNELILVLDEAHMYRGTGGAEVALLIRRLMARLGIKRERLRCILTSASLGNGTEAEMAVKKFASDLTGISNNSEVKLELIKGVKEKRNGSRKGTMNEAKGLSIMNLSDFQQAEIDIRLAINAIQEVSEKLGWVRPRDDEDLREYLYNVMTGWGPAELLIEMISGKALKLTELSILLFPDVNESLAKKATESLIALGSYAKRSKDNKVLLPTRMHLFYRGLPGIYTCINPDCERRLDFEPKHKPILGRMYTIPLLTCNCNKKSRVFELLTHRDCGTAFLSGYIRKGDDSFIINEPTNSIGMDDEENNKLFQIELLVDGDPHISALHDCIEAWLDVTTGHMLEHKPKDTNGFIKVYKPASNPGEHKKTFRRCPVCLKSWRGQSKIMDLATKGEAPFANLVKSQLFLQPPRKEESLQYPNGGRKVLVFSDGRQKAARLARDIPREVEWDSFRQTITLAASRLKVIQGKDPKITTRLYMAFVSVVSDFNLQFFDGKDRLILMNAVKEFREDYDGDLREALDNEWETTIVPSYYRALLRQLCNREYSLKASVLGYVTAESRAKRNIIKGINDGVGNKLNEEETNAIIFSFLSELLDVYAFETTQLIPNSIRIEAAQHPQESWVGDGKMNAQVRELLYWTYNLSENEIGKLEDLLSKNLCRMEGNGYVIRNDSVVLKIDTSSKWYSCNSCTHILPVILAEYCVNCGSNQVEVVDPNNSEYIRSRKGFLRDSVIKTLNGSSNPKYVSAEEHTAQISNKDAGVIFASTERYELRFQDVRFNDEDGPVDILSCTTTMEVGIDIGSLVAVSLRNVPPQRENYQQRSGRAGRKGSSVSTVITYAQGGPHDSHYFHNPKEIVAGEPRLPLIKTDNAKIARRHIHSFLIQTFFHEMIGLVEFNSNKLFSVLGPASDFFDPNSISQFNLSKFTQWVNDNILKSEAQLLSDIIDWLPEGIVEIKGEWIKRVSEGFISKLQDISNSNSYPRSDTIENFEDNEEEDRDTIGWERDELLSFLFDEGLLPSYAFPTDLCSFVIEEKIPKKYGNEVKVKERPQQSIDKALSEYAPGRQIVVDKITYRSGGITSASSAKTDVDRAAPLFDEKLYRYVSCNHCMYVQDFELETLLDKCPICGNELSESEMLIPEVFHPEEGKPVIEGDRNQEFTYATSAQFPVPMSEEDITNWRISGKYIQSTNAEDRRLVMVNKGDGETNSGFSVCVKCGAAAVFNPEKPKIGPHERPYFIEYRSGVNVPPKCVGEFKRVLLGYDFRTDLLLLRFKIASPLVCDYTSNLGLNILNDSLRTIGEALLLASSQILDIDSSEFQVGYRFLKKNSEDSSITSDIYLFDTLSGGAGYAEQAGYHIDEILTRTLTIMEECPGDCDKSCTECLRHYKNQYWHVHLDRKLGASLLKYLLYGEIPHIESIENQVSKLGQIIRLLTLDGYVCKTSAMKNKVQYPLIVSGETKDLSIFLYPSLIDEVRIESLYNLRAYGGFDRCLVNEYLMMNNPTLIYNQIKSQLDKG